jgi:hypothetical protein
LTVSNPFPFVFPARCAFIPRSFGNDQSDQFQADIYPETLGDQPSLTAHEWFTGQNAPPKLINLAGGFVASSRREFVSQVSLASTSDERDPIKNPQSEKEVRFYAAVLMV